MCLFCAVDTSGEGGSLNKQQTVYILYIALAAADLLVVLSSTVMLFGIEAVGIINADYLANCGTEIITLS
jgi:hypothetical protein